MSLLHTNANRAGRLKDQLSITAFQYLRLEAPNLPQHLNVCASTRHNCLTVPQDRRLKGGDPGQRVVYPTMGMLIGQDRHRGVLCANDLASSYFENFEHRSFKVPDSTMSHSYSPTTITEMLSAELYQRPGALRTPHILPHRPLPHPVLCKAIGATASANLETRR
jgi:hypothetical protein